MFLEEEHRKELEKLYRDAEKVPIMNMKMGTKLWYHYPWKETRDFVIGLADTYGFNMKKIQGINLETGEILF